MTLANMYTVYFLFSLFIFCLYLFRNVYNIIYNRNIIFIYILLCLDAVKLQSWGLIFCHSLPVKHNWCSTCYLTYLFKMKDTFSHLAVLQCFSVFLLIYFVCISKYRSNTDHRQGHVSWDKSYRTYRHSPQFNLFKRFRLRRITWLTDIDILISEVFRTQFKIFLQIEENIWNISATHTQPPQTHGELPLMLPVVSFVCFTFLSEMLLD